MKEHIDADLMKRVFGKADLKPYTITSSGHAGAVLVTLGNLQIRLLDSSEEMDFPSPGHPEEEFNWVLEGKLAYRHGPVVRSGEAIFIVPNLPHPGTRLGKLLIVKCFTETPSRISPEVMNRVISPAEVDPATTVRFPSGSVIKPLIVTDNVSVCMIEAKPGAEFAGPGMPQKEILYVIEGRMEFNDGRVAKRGEAVCNLADIPHPGRYPRRGPIRLLEIKSPPNPTFVKYRVPMT